MVAKGSRETEGERVREEEGKILIGCMEMTHRGVLLYYLKYTGFE